MSRTATCSCGQLSVTVKGDPERVVACHCDDCQRRTGSVYQVSCWYFGEQIIAESGEYAEYRNPDNRGTEYRFCPTCGSTVYWYFSFLEGLLESEVYGISVGCFSDPDFPTPVIETHTGNRHNWVSAIREADSFHDSPPVDRLIPDESDPRAWRAEPRQLTHGEATVEIIESDEDVLTGHKFTASVLEVSPSGLRLSCDQLLEGCTLDIALNLDGTDKTMRLSAEVRWGSWDGDTIYEAGVEIIDHPLTDIDDWYDMLKTLPEL